VTEKLKQLPTAPGIYLHKNAAGKIIYVGKAKNLRNRVRQYFQSSRNMEPKTRQMVKLIADFEFIVVDNEVEALVLESNLIKKHKPRFNVLLKDDKQYPHLKLTNEPYPKVVITRKIVRALTRIQLGAQDCLYLGNLEARRDWGHARDYVEAMWLMLQQDGPEDYVIATGKQHSVRDFVCAVAQKLGIGLRWEGKGQDEAAFNVTTGERIVAIDPRYFRPAEVENLLGNAAKAREILAKTA